jgi:hypothetical protein
LLVTIIASQFQVELGRSEKPAVKCHTWTKIQEILMEIVRIFPAHGPEATNPSEDQATLKQHGVACDA